MDLLRRAGIPARTVQGILRTEPGADRYESGASAALYHRWIEVFYPDRDYVFSIRCASINGVDASYIPFGKRALSRPKGLAPDRHLLKASATHRSRPARNHPHPRREYASGRPAGGESARIASVRNPGYIARLHDREVRPAEIDVKWQRRWERDSASPTWTPRRRPATKFYMLNMFPYPSGSRLHVGHGRNYILGRRALPARADGGPRRRSTRWAGTRSGCRRRTPRSRAACIRASTRWATSRG